MNKMIFLLAFACSLFISLPALSQTITIGPLESAPKIDGNADDWQAYKAVEIPVEGELNVKSISVKSGVVGDEAFFVFQWKDSSHDVEHKPYVWDANKGKYVAGEQMEDRLAINLAIEGDFTHDWLSGKTFKADMWHWKASRSNPIGLAQDKLTIITTEVSKKAYTTTAANGKKIYILRPSDSGDKLYKTTRYATKEKERMPKYILSKKVTGSVADVKAKGVWQDGQWTVEMKRKLNTGNSDDRVFTKGTAVSASIAVFDHSGDEHHNISKTFEFQF